LKKRYDLLEKKIASLEKALEKKICLKKRFAWKKEKKDWCFKKRKKKIASLEKELETSFIWSGIAESFVWKLYNWVYCSGDGPGEMEDSS